MELVHAVGLQQPHLLGGDHRRHHAPRFRVVVQPSNIWPSQSGTLTPDIADMRRSPAKLVTGMMPGTIGAVIPAARQRSRKRR